MRRWLEVKAVLVLLSSQKTLLNYLQVRENSSSSAKTLEGDELFFQTNRSSRLVMNSAISANTSELRSIPHSTLAFSPLLALVIAAT